MVIASEPDPTFCSSRQIVPDILHKVFVGAGCPPINDFVSLLTAALLLKPTSIYYHRTAPWAGTSCEAQLGQCFSGLGIRINEINTSEPNSSFGHATRNFRLRPSFAEMGRIHGAWGVRAMYGVAHMSDFIRLHYLNEMGGYYFDSDAFVVNSSIRRFRSCPFVLSTLQVDYMPQSIVQPSVEQVLAGTKVSDTHLLNYSKRAEFNNGAMLAVPGSEFGAAWWDHNRKSDGSMWSYDCCKWPPQWERNHPDQLQADPGMRSFPLHRFHPNMSWADHVELVASKGVSSIHLQHVQFRPYILVVANIVLERAVRLAGGRQALSPALLMCVDLAHELLRKTKGEHGDHLGWNNVQWQRGT